MCFPISSVIAKELVEHVQQFTKIWLTIKRHLIKHLAHTGVFSQFQRVFVSLCIFIFNILLTAYLFIYIKIYSSGL